MRSEAGCRVARLDEFVPGVKLGDWSPESGRYQSVSVHGLISNNVVCYLMVLTLLVEMGVNGLAL